MFLSARMSCAETDSDGIRNADSRTEKYNEPSDGFIAFSFSTPIPGFADDRFRWAVAGPLVADVLARAARYSEEPSHDSPIPAGPEWLTDGMRLSAERDSLCLSAGRSREVISLLGMPFPLEAPFCPAERSKGCGGGGFPRSVMNQYLWRVPRVTPVNRTTRMSENNNEKRRDSGPQTGVVIKSRTKTRRPSMYKVLMLNDDYTPMEFVVHVLERFFGKSRDEATRIMLSVHQRGVGLCGIYTYEVAETKVTQVMELARKNQHPLQCTIEKE